MIKKIKGMISYLSKNFALESYMGDNNLHFGCGNKILDNFINVDYYNKKYANELVDLNEKLPYQSDSIDLIYSDNVFEHIQNFLQLMQECNRILKPGGTLIVKVPYFKSKHAFVDPTHVNFFTIQSMDYYVKNKYFYDEYKFFEESFKSLEVFLDPNNCSILKKIVGYYAIKRPNVFENSILSNLFVFHNIVFVLKK